MNKKDLIDDMARNGGITKSDAEKALNAFTNSLTNALKKKDKVTLIGFGTFSINERAARKGRNPQTGKTIAIPAKNVPKFKAGSKLLEACN